MRASKIRRWASTLPVVLLVGGALLVAACATGAAGSTAPDGTDPANNAAAPAPAAKYTPRTMSFMVSAVPLVTHEMQGAMDFLQKDFAAGGLLDGKEVYGFYPSTITVYQGDSVHITFLNPEDDPHTIVIPDAGVNVTIAGESKADATFTAAKPGIYYMGCTVDEHSPYMWGQIVVLPSSDAPQG